MKTRSGFYTAQFSDGTVKTENILDRTERYTHCFCVTGTGERGFDQKFCAFAASSKLAKEYARSWSKYVTNPKVEIVAAQLVVPKPKTMGRPRKAHP